MQTTPSTLFSLFTVLFIFVATSITNVRFTQGFCPSWSIGLSSNNLKKSQGTTRTYTRIHQDVDCPYQHHHARSSSLALQGMKSPFDDFSGDDDDDAAAAADGHLDSFDVEAARRKLETLVGGAGGGSASGTVRDGTRSSNTMDTLDQGQKRQPPPRQQRHSHRQQTQQKPNFVPRRSFSIRSFHGDNKSNGNDASNNNSDTLPLPSPPPLTSIDRERKRAEMDLLLKLNDSDEALSDLWNLWFYERGRSAGARLLAAEELAAQPDRHLQAEIELKELMNEYGLHWVEPVHRLATLYYQQGRLLQAEQLFRTVLAVKPWHVGALSGVVVSYAERHAVHEARRAAALRLPRLAVAAAAGSSNRRRQQWVARAVAQAETNLARAEERLRVGFGQEDEHVTMRPNTNDDNSDNINVNNDFHRRLNVMLKESKVDEDVDKDAWQ